MYKKIIILICIVMLSSCNSADIIGDTPLYNVCRVENVIYDIEFLYVYNFFIHNDRIYSICEDQTKQILYSHDLNGKDSRIENFPFDVDDNHIFYFTMNDEYIMSIFETYDTAEKFLYTVNIYTNNGEFLSSYDLHDNKITAVTMDNSGNVYLGIDKKLIILSDDLYELPLNDNIKNIISTNDKVIINHGNKLNYINTADKNLGDDIDLPIEIDTEFAIFSGAGYDIYIKDKIGLYGFNIDDSEPIQLINWENSDILESKFSTITVISNDKFITSINDYLTNKNIVELYIKIPDDEVKQKENIVLAFNKVDEKPQLLNAVINFNRKNEKYRIVVRDSFDDTDIVSGNIPDIIVSRNYEDIIKYAEKGLFTNLYELCENDSDISHDVLFNCVKEPFEINNELYQICTSFMIKTLVGKSQLVGENEGWTINEFIKYMNESQGESISMMNMNRNKIFEILFTIGYDSFIDYDNSTCDFNVPEFIDILNYLYTLPNVPDDSLYNDKAIKNKNFRDGKIVLNYDDFMDIYNYLNYKFIFNQEEFTFKGYPSHNNNGSIVIPRDCYSITKDSTVKEGAWEFIKYMISEEVQNTIIVNFPSTVRGFQNIIEYYKTNYLYVTLNGGMYGSPSEFDEDDYKIRYGDGELLNITDEDEENIINFFNSSNTVYPYNNIVYDIIYEEVQIFFSGTKTAEETAKVTQSRVLNYINEK